MGKENDIFKYRRWLLHGLHSRLDEDFGTTYQLGRIFDNIYPGLKDEDSDSNTGRDDLASEYNDLLDLAASVDTSKPCAVQDQQEWMEEAEFPLPPYDEVSLCAETEEVRLLQLLPGKQDEPIICNLFLVDSVTLYEYEALSYVWGNTEKTHLIYVNDWEMAITENLDTALRALRDEEEPRLLWTDAVCINQSSIPEKSSQVGKMGEIYRAAKKVLVFLGPENDASETVFNFLENGYSELPDLGQHHERAGAFSGLDASAYLVEHHLPLIEAFVDPIFRPWFSRIWVRQEYIGATEIPSLYCGRRHLKFPEAAFNMLCEAVFLLPTLLRQPISEIVAPHQYHQVFSRAVSVFQTMNSAKIYPERLDTWLLNEGISGCDASDPRDLIFSICALLDSVASDVLKADYSQSREHVFMRASAWVLMMEQAPRMLVEYPPLDEKMPSWVMDFAKARPTSKHHEFVATFDSNFLDMGDENPDDEEVEEEEIEEQENREEEVQEEGIEEEDEAAGVIEQQDVDSEIKEAQQIEEGNKVQDEGADNAQEHGIMICESSTQNSYPSDSDQSQADEARIRRIDSPLAESIGELESQVNAGPSSSAVAESDITDAKSMASEDVHVTSTHQEEAENEIVEIDEEEPDEPGSALEQEEEVNVEEEHDEEEETSQEDEDEEPLPIQCSLYQQILSIPGIELDTIEYVYEFSSLNRLEAISKLWHLEKMFQNTPELHPNTSTSGITSLKKSALLLQWTVKLPINHMISALIPRSEHYIEFLDAELEQFTFSAPTSPELLEDLLGALLFDYPSSHSEMCNAYENDSTASEPPAPSTDMVLHFSSMTSNEPRYKALTSHLLTSDSSQNAKLIDVLHELATRTLPSLLQQHNPPVSPRRQSLDSTPTTSTPYSIDEPTLHNLPRTHTDYIQAWENEREDIFLQLFQSCCFFQTQHGFPGLGAFGLQGLRSGDRVVMLQGVPMPMALRSGEGDESLRIVGPVVMRGIMDGEVKGLVRDGILKKKMFRIR